MTITTAVPAGYKVEQVDLHEADDRLIDRVVAFMHAVNAEAVPEDPPAPADALRARLRLRSKFGERTDWLAWKGDELIGRISLHQNKSGSNEHIRDIGLNVLAPHRRRGVGSALFSTAVATLPDDGSVKLVETWTSTRVPSGAAFAERLGAKKGLHMRVSQVDLRTIDRDLMRQWAHVDPKGYHLEPIEDAIPERLMSAAVEAFNAINRMPREGLEMEDWKFTPELIRDWERQMKARGQHNWTLLAIEDATGAGVGFTGVFLDHREPTVVHQGGTAVDPAHQGRDIGKWLKGAMAEKIATEMPEARFIRTDNAGTNAPMLAINDRMGFREAWWGDIWQLPLEDAKRYARS